MYFKFRKMSISKKITLIYAVALFIILLSFNSAVVYLVRNVFINGSNEELTAAASFVEASLKDNHGYVPREFEKLSIGYNIFYNIYDENSTLLHTNNPELKPLEIKKDELDKVIRERIFNHDTVILYMNKDITINGKLYFVQVAKSMGQVGAFAKTFARTIFFTCLFGIFVCLLSGLYLSKKVLKPLRNITATAKELTSRSLDKRITIDGPEDEFKELANTFNSMIERLETDFEKQQRFVSDASHELRTPLAVIHGNVNMLSRWGKDDPQVLNQSLETLKKETENMNKLIANLLYLASSDSNRISLKKETFHLNLLFKEVVDETLLVHGEYSVSYRCEPDCVLNADYNSVKQLLRILLDNSLKFSTPPGEITIQSERKENGSIISVTDKGTGISPEVLPFIFDRFYKADESRNKAAGGTGLGLSIAKQIVQSHNGNILVNSKPGEGTTVEIFFP